MKVPEENCVVAMNAQLDGEMEEAEGRIHGRSVQMV